MSMARTYVTVGGPLVPGNGKRGMALIEGESRSGDRIMAFVAGKTAEECRNNFLERKHRSSRILAFTEQASFRPNYVPIPENIVDMAQLKAEGFQIFTYPSSPELFLIPDEKPTPDINYHVGARVRNFVGNDLLNIYCNSICTADEYPKQLTTEMVKEVLAIINLDITDELAEKLSLTKSAGGSAENIPPQTILEALVDIGKNAELICTNGRQFGLFARREEFFPSAPAVDETHRPESPMVDAPDRPRFK